MGKFLRKKFRQRSTKRDRAMSSSSVWSPNRQSSRYYQRYTLDNDKTLTNAQNRQRAFRTLRKYRAASNATIHRHSSGYHEVVPTDFIEKIVEVNHVQNTITRSSLTRFNGITINPDVQASLQTLADGFRTDTARTILSSAQGRVAGHSGSGIIQTNQAEAHDMLRNATFKLLEMPLNGLGLSEKSVACVLGSIAVTSIAPGMYARNVQGGTRNLKDTDFKLNYEQAREEAKSRVEHLYGDLTLSEQSFVYEHASNFIQTVSPPATRGRQQERLIPQGRATSPRRSLDVRTDEVSGGAYLQQGGVHVLLPQKDIPQDIEAIGFWITEPFRADRRQ
ncbi:hypothetical protein M2306_000462 [Myroides gitamensis]|nr:hypothetical protein [Myroides gitamensis]